MKKSDGEDVIKKKKIDRVGVMKRSKREGVM